MHEVKQLYCGPSGKLCFAIRRKAKQFADREFRLHARELRVYRCPKCKAWHLATKHKKRRVKS